MAEGSKSFKEEGLISVSKAAGKWSNWTQRPYLGFESQTWMEVTANLEKVTSIILISTLPAKYYCLYFTDKQTRARRGSLTYSGSHTQ